MKRTIHLPLGVSITIRTGDCTKIAYGSPVAATRAAYSLEAIGMLQIFQDGDDTGMTLGAKVR